MECHIYCEMRTWWPSSRCSIVYMLLCSTTETVLAEELALWLNESASRNLLRNDNDSKSVGTRPRYVVPTLYPIPWLLCSHLLSLHPSALWVCWRPRDGCRARAQLAAVLSARAPFLPHPSVIFIVTPRSLATWLPWKYKPFSRFWMIEWQRD